MVGLDRAMQFPTNRATEARLEEAGVEFQIRMLQESLALRPRNPEALAELASLLTRTGRCEEGLAVDLRLAGLQPGNPIVFYNLACTYSLLGRNDDALRCLQRAIELGYRDLELLQKDEDLVSLRRDPRFRHILESLHGRPAR